MDRFLETVPHRFGRYIEPFVGSGAFFFALRPHVATLSDLNPDLINAFVAIRDDWARVAALLRGYQSLHSKDFYYKMRDARPRTIVTRAAKFIYLNRTCWNGLFRVNRQGQFNVPIGTKRSVILPSDDFQDTSELLRTATLRTSDFEPIIRDAQKGDFVFADPPYVTAHSQNGFLKYNEKLFSWDDQLRLASALIDARSRGVHVMSTNADCPIIRQLYKGSFSQQSIDRGSRIAADSKRRGSVSELLITSW